MYVGDIFEDAWAVESWGDHLEVWEYEATKMAYSTSIGYRGLMARKCNDYICRCSLRGCWAKSRIHC